MRHAVFTRFIHITKLYYASPPPFIPPHEFGHLYSMAWTRVLFSRVFSGGALWRVVREVLVDEEMVRWVCVGMIEAKHEECKFGM
jgi:hypothetical protein